MIRQFDEFRVCASDVAELRGSESWEIGLVDVSSSQSLVYLKRMYINIKPQYRILAPSAL